jgi:uncharacterized protein (DUF58 family)
VNPKDRQNDEDVLRSCLHPRALAALAGLKLRAEKVAAGVLAGRHLSRSKGESTDFVEHQPYSPGDEPRRIDWRVFGRSDRFLVRQQEAEKNLRLVLLVDFSASMSYASGELSKIDYACILAAALASLALRQGDVVGLVAVKEGQPLLVPPAGGAEHLRELVGLLEHTACSGGTQLAPAVEKAASFLGRAGLLLLFSDLFDPQPAWARALKLQAAGGRQAMVFHVLDRDEAEFPFEDPAQFESLEDERKIVVYPRELRRHYLREFNSWMEELRREFSGPGLLYEKALCQEPPHQPLIRALSQKAPALAGRGL